MVEDYGRWSSSGTGQDRQDEWEGDGDDDDDDKTSGSDETLSLSYHDKDTAAHHGEMLRARTTRQLVSLHADRRHYAPDGTHAFASARVLDL